MAWLDDLVDVATSSSDVGIGKLLNVLRDQFFSSLFGIRCSLDLILKKDVDGTFGTHHGDLGCGPGVVDVATHMLATHHVVGTTIGFTCNHGDLGNSCFAVSEEQLGTVTDDAAVLLTHTWQEAGDIDEGN